MSYVLNAVLAPSELLTSDPPWLSGSRIVHLEQSMSMIPITDDLFDRLAGQEPFSLEDGLAIFSFLPPQLAGVLQSLSEHSTVAYVEAEFFGGTGEQRCVVWQKSAVILGPLEARYAINRALRLLDVKRQWLHDEFDMIGLNRHRHNEDWITGVT